METGVDVDADGDMLVDVTADVTDSLLAQLKEQGALIYGSYPAYRSVRALVPAARLESIASLSDVIFIGPKQETMTAGYSSMTLRNGASPRLVSAERSTRVRSYLQSILRPVKNVAAGVAPTGQGSETSEGDLTHRAFDARMAFGVNGAGIKIGVLSDGASSLAASQALGDLPSDVTVLPGQVGGGDEGTAMMEIVSMTWRRVPNSTSPLRSAVSPASRRTSMTCAPPVATSSSTTCSTSTKTPLWTGKLGQCHPQATEA